MPQLPPPLGDPEDDRLPLELRLELLPTDRDDEDELCEELEDPLLREDLLELELAGAALPLGRLAEDRRDRELPLEIGGPLELLGAPELSDGRDETELSPLELDWLSLTDDQDLAEPVLIWDRHY